MDNVENIVEEVELTAAQKLAQFEKEKLSRRQALARFGFQAGAAAVAALTADDLLRKVGKEMQRRAGDNKVAQQVAKEFERAGIASAAIPDICPPGCCDNCYCQYQRALKVCDENYIQCLGLPPPYNLQCYVPLQSCKDSAAANYNTCKAGCSNGGLGC